MSVETIYRTYHPLRGLTNLEWLHVGRNDISDVSPIVGLTNLTWLAIYNNEITDLSPLEGLRENIKLVWHGQSGVPHTRSENRGSMAMGRVARHSGRPPE